jgi:hypothetical protein
MLKVLCEGFCQGEHSKRIYPRSTVEASAMR